MKLFTGKVHINNGRFDRSFEVRVHACNLPVASSRAVQLSLFTLRNHLKTLGVKKRCGIDNISISLSDGGIISEEAMKAFPARALLSL